MKEAAEAKASVLKDFDSQHLANTASACTIDGHASSGLSLANTASACIFDGHASPELYTVAIAAAATSCSTDSTSQRLANTDWASAKAGHFDATRMEDVTSEALPSGMKNFKSRDLANTAISLLCAVDDTPDAQYLAQALLPFYFMAITAFIGSRSRTPFPTPGKAWMVWTFSTELLAYMAVSLTCAVGDTPSAQYLIQAWNVQYIMAITASISIGTGISFRHLARPVWFGLASPETFDAITEVTDNHLRNFNSQHLAHMDWAYFMAMTASLGSKSRIPFLTPGMAWMVWTLSTELLAYMAVSLTCAVGDTHDAQYLTQAWHANYIMAMTASIRIGTGVSLRHLARLVWFGLSAAAMGGKHTCCAVSRPGITSLLHNGIAKPVFDTIAEMAHNPSRCSALL